MNMSETLNQIIKLVSTEMPILEIDNVRKIFGGNTVLDGITMSLDAGKVYQLIGPNGCGKTTLINVISGAMVSSGGSIIYDGNDITNKSMLHTYRLGLGRTFQIPQSFTNLSTLENVQMATGDNIGESFLRAAFHNIWKKDETRSMNTALGALEKSGILDKQSIQSNELSGGQSKLLELSKAIAGNAKLLLMDEPIAGVNPKLAHNIFKMIQEMAHKSMITFLIIEHRLDISLEYADYAFAMDNGKIVANGTPREIITNERVAESYLGK